MTNGPVFLDDLIIPPCFNSVNATQSMTTCLETSRKVAAEEAYNGTVRNDVDFKILQLSGSINTCKDLQTS